MDMLSDNVTYEELGRDPTLSYRIDLNNLVDYGFYTRVLNKKRRFLVPSYSGVPTIYTLPKVHKDLSNPPARPIVNGIVSVSARVGQYLDHFLQESVVWTKAYLKDTSNFLQLL